MTQTPKPTLEQQREALRQQLRMQRASITEQLGPVPDPDEPRFPRSATMRFLTGKTGFMLLSRIATWKLGGALPRFVIAAQTANKLFNNRKKSPPSNKKPDL